MFIGLKGFEKEKKEGLYEKLTKKKKKELERGRLPSKKE